MQNFPREGRVTKLYLKKYNTGIRKPIGPQLVMLSIFEDIMKPSIYAEFLIRDFGNLLQDWELTEGGLATEGDESIVVTVEDPVNTHKVLDYEFGIVSVTNSGSNPTELGQTYIIRAISIEHLKNTQKLVTKSYNDKAENIVEDIVKNFLSSKKTFLKDDPTKDTVLLTIPTYNSFKAIDMIRKRAVSKQYPNSPYLFYESNAGYNFATIDYIVNNSKTCKPITTYTTKTAIETDFEDDGSKPLHYKNILHYEIVKSFNTFEKLTSGAMAVNVLSFDITTKQYQRKKYDVKTAKLPLTTDDKGVLYKDNLYETFPDAGHYVFLPSSVDTKPTIVENAGDKEIASALFGDTAIVLKVAGDLTVALGDVINIEIPSRDDAAKLDKFEFAPDLKYSGNYMVTKMRHMFSLDEYDMVIEAVKIGKKK